MPIDTALATKVWYRYAWARDNGFDVPVRGLLPQRLIDAYTAAQQPTDTAEAGAA